MFYGQDTISEVKALNDIVDVVGAYVKLSPRSGNFFGLCPFHSEKTPSFSVNRDKQIFYCFGCGAGGNVISFIKRIENMDFPDALRLLADRVHFILPEKGTSGQQEKFKAAARETAAKLNKLAARFYYENLHGDSEEALAAREYLKERDVDAALVKRFGLGLAPDSWDGLLREFPDIPPVDFETAGLVKRSEKKVGFYDRFRGRLMFPIIDTRARILGFGGRVLREDDDSAKYINSPETELFKKSECLYGLHLAKKARAGGGVGEIIIVEGYMDVLTMHQHGFVNTVGVLGTALRASHVRLIKNAGAGTAVLILDSDEAGIRAALRAIPVLIKENLKVKILQIPDAKDPDEYLTKFGAARFAHLLTQAVSHITFQVNLLREKFDLNTTDGRVAFTQEAAKILASLDSFIEADAYASEIAKDTDISHSAITKEIEKITGESRMKTDLFINLQNRKIKPRGEDIGVTNAKKGLLSLLFTEPAVKKALQSNNYISSEEMGGFYGRLFDFALSSTEKTGPSDVFDFFEENDEQRVIAEIFTDEKKYASQAAVCKALNDMLKQILLFYVNSRIETEKNDLNAVNSMLFRKKSINSLNISFDDCQ